MKRNLLLVLLAFTSIATFAQNQINDQVRKANLFIDGGMLFSIQKLVSQSSTENEVEFCGNTSDDEADDALSVTSNGEIGIGMNSLWDE